MAPTEPENRATSFRVPRSSAKLRLELLKSWKPNFNERVHYYGDLERKYSGAEQLIVKLQTECQTLKREPDGKPPCGIEPEIIAKLARTSARIYELGISYNGRTDREGKKINWKEGLRAPMS